MAGKKLLPYGTWPSPIRPQTAGLDKRFLDVQWGRDGKTLFWVEGRSGKGVLVCRERGDAPADLSGEYNVRGGIGYGGGEFCPARDFAVFAEADGRLYRVPIRGGRAFPITPEFGAASSPAVSPDEAWVLYVHEYEDKDRLAIVDSSGRDWPRILAEGADFYMQPAWAPEGDAVAWVEWDHPQMPWDGARLRLLQMDGSAARDGNAKTLIGGKDRAVFQPAFSPDGTYLACIAADGDADALILLDRKTSREKTLLSGIILADPAWAQGLRTYGWSPDSKRIFFRRNDAGVASLWSVGVQGGDLKKLGTDPFTWFDQPAVAPDREALACMASSPSAADQIVVWEKNTLAIQAYSAGEKIAPDFLTAPVPIEWTAPDGGIVHGLFYAPSHPSFEGQGLPPAVIDIHGGPTSQRMAGYAIDAAYFASRGYAYLSVNYRGSTGYGRAYMRALQGRWGDLDVVDAVSGARALCERGLADPARLVIKGGSAGGYTVLNALIRHPGLFRAGVCLFGVSNLFTLGAGTIKFESHYEESLIGPLPDAAEKYRAWSPLFHADRIRDPLAIFHGDEDKVVPPAQSAELAAALTKQGVPHLYRVFPGEGHGWRKPETIAAYYAALEEFLQQHVLYS